MMVWIFLEPLGQSGVKFVSIMTLKQPVKPKWFITLVVCTQRMHGNIPIRLGDAEYAVDIFA